MKKISVISGGAGGMGKAIAKELGKYSSIVLGDINQGLLLAAKKELCDLGIETYTLQLDVKDIESVNKFASFGASLGEVVNVIHTAGVSPTNTLGDEIIRINAVGTVNMVEGFYPVIAAGGIMINVASIAAHLMSAPDEAADIYKSYDQPDFFDKMWETVRAMTEGGDDFAVAGVAYCLSKNFVIHFTKMNVARFANKNCRILSVSPGSFLTPMHQSLIDNQPDTAESQLMLIPCNRWGHPFEIGVLVDFLCSSGAQYINGIDILIDGGQLSNIMIEQI